jgi:hypothetical protein
MTANDADLLAILVRWDQLPEHIRKTVSELVRLAVPSMERHQIQP